MTFFRRRQPDRNARVWDTACGKYNYRGWNVARYYKSKYEKERAVDLDIYKCPNGRGLHLTSHSWKETRDGA